MVQTIKELTLLLIYLTSWQEDVGSKKVQRSWKGKINALYHLTLKKKEGQFFT
jgi:hypothetical protein